MTGRPNQMLRSSQRAREVEEYQSRHTTLNAEALRKAEARLEGYVASRRKAAAAYRTRLR